MKTYSVEVTYQGEIEAKRRTQTAEGRLSRIEGLICPTRQVSFSVD